MFGKKAKLQQVISLQNARIEELEFALCHGEHDFVEIGRRTSYIFSGGYVDSNTAVKYKCRRCGKVIVKTDIPYAKEKARR